jgi:hypothetical protein
MPPYGQSIDPSLVAAEWPLGRRPIRRRGGGNPPGSRPRYMRSSAEPQTNPEPNATRSTSDPGRIRPERRA